MLSPHLRILLCFKKSIPTWNLWDRHTYFPYVAPRNWIFMCWIMFSMYSSEFILHPSAFPFPLLVLGRRHKWIRSMGFQLVSINGYHCKESKINKTGVVVLIPWTSFLGCWATESSSTKITSLMVAVPVWLPVHPLATTTSLRWGKAPLQLAFECCIIFGVFFMLFPVLSYNLFFNYLRIKHL